MLNTIQNINTSPDCLIYVLVVHNINAPTQVHIRYTHEWINERIGESNNLILGKSMNEQNLLAMSIWMS